VTKAKILQLPESQDRLIMESEYFTNVWYEVKGDAVCINVTIEGKHIALPGKFDDMKALANELLSVIDVWGGL